MDSKSADTSSQHPIEASDVKPSASSVSEQDSSAHDSSSMECKSSISSWARSLKGPQPLVPAQENSQTGNAGKPTFARLASGLGLNLAQKASGPNENSGDTAAASSTGVLESFRKGLVDSSLNAVKAVQVKAHHVVSQNKRRYQGGFDLDMTYITDNIIAMGFPADDMSSGGYRNHMEEVIKFFETHHKDKYKVYNLCSERLYDASLFEGKVASFPFDGHNFPPIHLIPLFCQSAYSWLKDDILNVVAVHCKAGKARTGLMICSLLLFLKFFPTAEECIDYYNQKRCVDGKGLILPSQIRYVKYYEHILTNYSGQNPPGRRCMLRGFRLHTCPYWVRPSITVSNHNARRFLDSCTKKRDCGFALPGEPGLTELKGDIKIHFQDRHGDFYCWLNTAMMENRLILNASDLDDFDKRKLPSPGFKVETVMIDYDGTTPARYKVNQDSKGSNQSSKNGSSSTNEVPANSNQSKVCGNQDNDDVFSNSDGEEAASSCRSLSKVNCGAGTAATTESGKTEEQIASVKKGTKQLLLGSKEPTLIDTSNEIRNDKVGSSIPNLGSGDIKAIAADASVFTFGDDEDYESE